MSADLRSAPPLEIGRLIDDGRWSGYQQWLVFLVALMVVFDGVDNQLLGIVIPTLMGEWGVPRRAFAPVVSYGYAGMMLGGAIAGLAGDRLGRRAALLGSVVLFGVMTAVSVLARSPGELGILRLLAGIGLGGAMPNAAALAAEFVPIRRRPIAVTVTIVCVPLGATLAGLLGIRLLPSLGWRTLFVIGGIVPIVAAALLARLLPESPRFLARHPHRWPELRATLRRMGHDVSDTASFADTTERAVGKVSVGELFTPAFRRDTIPLWGAFFSCLLAVYLGFSWLTSLLTGAGFDSATANIGITAFNLGGVAGALCGGWAIARVGSRVAMLTMTALAIVGALGLSTQTIAVDGADRADHRDARVHRRHDQRRADDDVRPGRARLPERRPRHRRRYGRVVRSIGRDSQRLRRRLGPRVRARRVLRLDCRLDDRDVRFTCPRAAARSAARVVSRDRHQNTSTMKT